MMEAIINLILAMVVVVTIAFPSYLSRKDPHGLNRKQRSLLLRIRVCGGMVLMLQVLPSPLFLAADTWGFPGLGRLLRLVGFLVAYVIIGHDIVRKALRGIGNKQLFDENFLMTIATIGALAIAISTNGDYLEAVAVMLFYQLGELFQSYAIGKSRRSIQSLMDIRPDYANIPEDGKLVRVAPEEVAAGSIIVVQPGEKIPIDGVVERGDSSLNTSALTGESMPREVAPGDAVSSGCINMTRVLEIRTDRAFGESTVARLLELMENASSRKSRSEDFISKFSRVYTPAVCGAALALAILPPLVRFLLGLSWDFGTWVYRALTFLVISCPCALVISVPLAFFAGIGGASRAGILIKGSNYLETLAKVKTVVLDKTGTLTKGEFQVVDLQCQSLSRRELLEQAAHAEVASSHPIARSILAAYGKEVDRNRVTELQELSGYGSCAKVDGVPVAVGSGKLMQQLGIAYPDAPCSGTAVHVAVDGRYAGRIEIADVVKPSSPTAIRKLKQVGIRKIIMLTGDSSVVANRLGKELGLDEIFSQLLPGDKVQRVERLLQEQSPQEKLAFVGDGINDAPVLSRADVGIAMGAMGSDAAIEAADVVLMDDNPEKIALAIRFARRCIRIVKQNILFSLGVKLVCLALGAVGISNMWFAIFADVGVMVLAVLNGIRALRIGRPTKPNA